LSVNPELLIIVEGIEVTATESYWWGGNLTNAATAPVTLSVDHQLVYSIHDYPASVFAQTWFSATDYPNNLAGVWDTTWGYLAKSGTAPIWVGEFGSKLETTVDQQWMTALVQYISDNGLGFAFWSWNPDSGDTGGILQDDWMTVNTDKMTVITRALAPKI
jgi:endoglucanase